MSPVIHWPSEFAAVIGCTRCPVNHCTKLVRDEGENIPQPGFIGRKYEETRILLVGQNPGLPKSFGEKDIPYTAAMREVRDKPGLESYEALRDLMMRFLPRVPIYRNHFPMEECDLTLDDIAYCNLVRCRTLGDSGPRRQVVSECMDAHFKRWLKLLEPRGIVFIGKWAWKRGQTTAAESGIPCAYINRQRNLSAADRASNRTEVARFVQRHSAAWRQCD